jgi:hypothetical protein
MQDAKDLKQAIHGFAASWKGRTSRSVFVAGSVPAEVERRHRARHPGMAADEPILLLLNKGPMSIFGVPINAFTGIALTASHLHYCTMKYYFLGFIPVRGQCSAVPLGELESVRIGNYDISSAGQVGHELLVNGCPRGFVRMGTGLFPDHAAIDFLNRLFSSLRLDGLLAVPSAPR